MSDNKLNAVVDIDKMKERCWSCRKDKNDVELRACDDRLCNDCFLANEAALDAERRGIASNVGAISTEHAASLGHDRATAASITAQNNAIPRLQPMEVTTNELLCFLQQKGKVLAFDQLVGLCVDFYTIDEIETARVLLAKYVVQRRIAKQKGADREVAKRTLTAALKVCLDPSVNLPQFAAINLARLPPVGVEHVDVSSMLQELQALRSEVRVIADLRVQIADMREVMQKMVMDHATNTIAVTTTTNSREVETRPKVVQDLPLVSTESSSSISSARPVQPVYVRPGHGPTTPASNAGGQRRTTAEVVNSAVVSGALDCISSKTRSAARTVVGKAVRTNLKSVPTKRSIDLFISRLSPDCRESDICDSVSAVLAGESEAGTLAVDRIKCVKLTTKFDSYASFHLSVFVDASCHRNILQLLMDADSWPCGILVRRFFNDKRNG